MMLPVIFLGLFSLTGVNAVLRKDILFPPFVFSFIWLLQILGLIILSDQFIAPSELALLIVFFGALIFSIGTYTSLFISKKNLVFFRGRDFTQSNKWLVIFLILGGVCAYQQYQIMMTFSASGSSFAERLVISRLAITGGGEDLYGVYKYGYLICLIGLLAAFFRINKAKEPVNLVLLIGFLSFSLVMAVLSTGRGRVLEVFMVVGFTYLASQKKIFFEKRIVYIALGIVAAAFLIFWIMGSAMGKASADIGNVMEDINKYQFSSIPAFSIYLSKEGLTPFGHDYGRNTLRFFYAMASAFGFRIDAPSLIQDFVYVPSPTNIYGIYHLYIKDFGIFGFVFFTYIIGLIHGMLYIMLRAQSSNHFVIVLFALSLLPLVRSVGGETYFTGISFWIQCLAILFLLTKSRNLQVA